MREGETHIFVRQRVLYVPGSSSGSGPAKSLQESIGKLIENGAQGGLSLIARRGEEGLANADLVRDRLVVLFENPALLARLYQRQQTNALQFAHMIMNLRRRQPQLVSQLCDGHCAFLQHLDDTQT